MNTITSRRDRHRGPHPGIVAIIYALLFNAGLYFVVSFRLPEHLAASPTAVRPYFPGPWESADTIAAYFQGHPHAVLMCAFLQFGAAIPLGIFTATMVSRLHLSRRARRRRLDCSVRRIHDRLQHWHIRTDTLGHGLSWHRPRRGGAPRVVLPRLFDWRCGILSPDGALDSWAVHSGGVHEAPSEMAYRIWPCTCGGRRIKCIEHGYSPRALSHSSYAISRIHLAHRCGIHATRWQVATSVMLESIALEK